MYQLQNDKLIISIQPKGAELTSLVKKQNSQEYIWQANPDVWGRHAPILFPIVGQVRNGTYSVNNEIYTITQHGFARDNQFDLIERSENKLVFQLNETEETLKIYPYQFELKITYQLEDDKLVVAYQVTNKMDKVLPFSIGAHPGFQFPNNSTLENFKLVFNKTESTDRIHIKDGLRDGSTTPLFLNSTNELPLKQSDFENDAVIFKNLNSDNVSIQSLNNKELLNIEFKNFPFLGIWTKPNSTGKYICIEPWHGITDSHHSSEKLSEKEGVTLLKPQTTFSCEFGIRIPD